MPNFTASNLSTKAYALPKGPELVFEKCHFQKGALAALARRGAGAVEARYCRVDWEDAGRAIAQGGRWTFVGRPMQRDVPRSLLR